MPVIAVNLAGKTFAEISSLVEQGLFVSPEQFLEIAAFNQLALERGSKPQALVDASRRPPVPADPKTTAVAPDRVPGQERKARSARAAPVGKRKNQQSEANAEALAGAIGRLSLESWTTSAPRPIKPERRPTGERLWGQVNRLFPLKLAARWIGIEASRTGEWPQLEEISDRLADDAATIGTALEAADGAAGRKRDELATGLPRRGNSASRDRFLSQFIARVTRNGEIYPGAVVQCALCLFDGDRLVLTDMGAGLARLKSPVLDGPMATAARTMSDEERAFFLRVVGELVPGESRDLSTILRAIEAGNVGPDALIGAVTPKLPPEWNAVMARTHVAGVVARASELGLIQRQWEGRTVKYQLTASAEALKALADGGEVENNG